MNNTYTNACGSGFAPTLRCQSTLVIQPDSRSRSLTALMSAGMALTQDSMGSNGFLMNEMRETSIG